MHAALYVFVIVGVIIILAAAAVVGLKLKGRSKSRSSSSGRISSKSSSKLSNASSGRQRAPTPQIASSSSSSSSSRAGHTSARDGHTSARDGHTSARDGGSGASESASGASESLVSRGKSASPTEGGSRGSGTNNQNGGSGAAKSGVGFERSATDATDATDGTLAEKAWAVVHLPEGDGRVAAGLGKGGVVDVMGVISSVRWDLGNAKSRRVLPFSVENETACTSSYECSPLAAAERWRLAELRSKGASRPNRGAANASGGPIFRPCDPSTISIPAPFFKKGRKRYFFAIGINYVSQPKNRLTSCWNDVDAIKVAMEKRFGTFDQSWIITDRAKDLRSGVSPQMAPVRTLWDEMMRKCKSETEDVDIMFLYSGHGTFRLTTDPGELGGQSDALVFLDELLYDYDVMAHLIRPLPRNARLFILFDSCNSGSAANLPWTFNPLSSTVNQTSLHTDLTSEVVMLSGCRDEQTSAAGATSQDLSECTRVLIECLNENADINISFTTLVKTMRTKLIAAQDTQIPQLSISKPNLLAALL